jgi:site-specific DNA recombinase
MNEGLKGLRSHSKKGPRRHRYYISSRLLSTGAADAAGWRLPARQLEQSVADAVLQHLGSRLPYLLKAPSPVVINQLKSALDDLTARSVLSLIEKTIVSPGTLQITLCPDTLSAHAGFDRSSLDGDQLKFTEPFQLVVSHRVV